MGLLNYLGGRGSSAGGEGSSRHVESDVVTVGGGSSWSLPSVLWRWPHSYTSRDLTLKTEPRKYKSVCFASHSSDPSRS